MNPLLAEEYKKIGAILNNEIYNLKDKTFYITGASGLIGSYFVNYLLFLNDEFNFNIKIYAQSRNLEKLEKKFKKNKNLFFVVLNPQTPIEFNIEADYIIYASSPSHPEAFAKYPTEVIKTNVLGLINIFEKIKNKDKKPKVLFLSSGEIYGNNLDKPFQESDSGLVDTKKMRSCYPESKRCAESICIAYEDEFKIPVNIARLCYIFGHGASQKENSRADVEFLSRAKNKQNIILKSKGLQKRTYCYISDCISALLKIILTAPDGEFYNVSNFIASVYEFASSLAQIADVKIEYREAKKIEKKGYSKEADLILDNKKLLALGWMPFYDLKTGQKHALELEKEDNYV